MSARRALALRSIHLRIVPRPANLSESREIFRVLQGFGEISTYQSLRYEYQNPADNVAFAIYRHESSAQSALDASPIRFALETSTATEDNTSTESHYTGEEDQEDASTDHMPQKAGIDEILRPSQLLNRTSTETHRSTPSAPPKPMPFDPPPVSPKQKKWTKWFQVTVDRAAYRVERYQQEAAECVSDTYQGAEDYEPVCGDGHANFEGVAEGSENERAYLERQERRV
ncbi:unnamed protein product [Alternaria alternata]